MILCHCWQISKNTYHGETRRPCTEGDANETEESTSNRSKTTATYTEFNFGRVLRVRKIQTQPLLGMNVCSCTLFSSKLGWEKGKLPSCFFHFCSVLQWNRVFLFPEMKERTKTYRRTVQECESVSTYYYSATWEEKKDWSPFNRASNPISISPVDSGAVKINQGTRCGQSSLARQQNVCNRITSHLFCCL